VIINPYNMSFESLNLIEPIQKALSAEGYTMPTPIQAQAIPIILQGTDLLGVAQTGTGKTAAFAIPILQLLHKNHTFHKGKRSIKALIITPTRELAIQIDDSFQSYGKYTGLTHTVIFGGVKQGKQTDALQNGVDILVATPGRLLDLINQRYISLKEIQLFVLDEADRMLDMGFVHDIKKVLAILPERRQSLFFSATMPPEIQKLSDSILYKPQKVEVTPASTTADTIKQALYFVDKNNKNALLLDILQDKSIETALVFTRTKHGADKVVKVLLKSNIKAEAIHGNKAQNARQRALENFKAKTTRVLVATDIAARGIDVDDLAYVINFEMPNIPETYVHRIGRTGRAGANGTAFSFCETEEIPYLKDIQKLIGKKIPVIENHDYPMSTQPVVELSKPPQNQHQNRGAAKPNEANKGKKVWFKRK
jgi:ATP-dependent RNA helicase RhlE